MQPIQFFAVDAVTGKVLPNAVIDVYVSGTNKGTRATLYSDAGVTSILNPTAADGSGRVYFFAAGNYVDIYVSSGSNSQPPILNQSIADPVDVINSTQAAVNALINPVSGAVANANASAAAAAASATSAQAAANSAANGVNIYATLSAMNADLTPAANVGARVVADTTLANNGFYKKVGGTGTGSWSFVGADPVATEAATRTTLGLTVQEISYANPRFTTVRHVVVDSVTNLVFSGVDVNGNSMSAQGAAIQTRTQELAYVAPRFTSLASGVLDSVSGLVISGFLASGILTGVQGSNYAALTQKVSEVSQISRFSSLAWAVVDSSSNVVLQGIRAVDGQRVSVQSDIAQLPASGAYPPASLVHVGALGQSTIEGAGGTSALTTSQAFRNVMFDAVRDPVTLTSFNPLVEANASGGLGETIASGWTAQFNNLHSQPVPMLATLQGQGGAPITTFIRGTAKYNALMADIVAAQTLASANGDTYQYFCTAYWQGQADDTAGTSYSTYLNLLETLALNLNTDIQALTGQTLPIRFLVVQIGTWIHQTAPVAALAHVQAMKDIPGLITVVSPSYFVPYAAGTSSEHPQNHGYRWIGGYLAKAQNAFMQGKTWKPLYPSSVKGYGSNSIMARFTLPGGYPLSLDNVLVSDPNGQYGFEYADDAGAATLTKVEQIGDDLIHVVTSRARSTNPFLRYAYTATLGASGGPTSGPRGCLRNTDPAVSYYSDASSNPYKLYDWCLTFSEPVT